MNSAHSYPSAHDQPMKTLTSNSSLISKKTIDNSFDGESSNGCSSRNQTSGIHGTDSPSMIIFNHKDSSSNLGVNRHSYSTARIRRMISDEEKLRAQESRGVSPSKYIDEMSSNPDCRDNESTAEYIFSIFDSTMRWFQAQKVKSQKQALEQAVEEQRQILLEETMKLNKNTKYDEGLNANQAYKSISQRYTSNASEVLSVGLCVGSSYVGDEDEDYVVEDEAASVNSGEDEFVTSNLNSVEDDHSLSTNVLSMPSDEPDSFRIGTPHGTYTGGIAVQLEFSKKKKKSLRGSVRVQQEKNCNIPFILNEDQMLTIAEFGLPPSVMFSKWTRLYCLQRDGDSFNGSFLRLVKGQVKTLLVVETTNRDVFGAYTNSPWEGHGMSGSSHFYGSAQASLFSVERNHPDETKNGVLVYKWTGKNRYIQVCDEQHKLLALGGGGKAGEFGLCVEDDFRIGSTGPCETFGNAPLCKEDQFEIMNLECWGFISGFC